METKEQLHYIRQLLFLVNEHPKLLKRSAGFCSFISKLQYRNIISKKDEKLLIDVLFLHTINPNFSKINRLGVRYSFFYRTSKNGYFFQPGCVWRRKKWLKRLILKLEKNEKTDAIIVKNPSIQIVPDMFRVIHRQYATYHYEYGSTTVKANSKEEAFNILNKYLETKPNGAYTALPCESIDDVYELHVLSY